MGSFDAARVKQHVYSFLVGRVASIQQGIGVWVGSPSPVDANYEVQSPYKGNIYML